MITKEQIKEMADMIAEKTMFLSKDLLTAEEAARYMGVAKSYLYKLTMRRSIPHYKPMGKMCYFTRTEIDEWLTQNRVKTAEEVDEMALEYCYSRKMR